MIVRPATVADIDEVIRVCDQAWKGIWQGDKEMFKDRIYTFLDCGVVVCLIGGCIEGYVSSQLADESLVATPSWDQATDYGHICKTHNVHGEWLHGIGLAVTPRGSRAGVTGGLVNYLYSYLVKHNIRGCRFITRMPGYNRYQDTMTPEKYVLARHNGKLLDPELRTLENYGIKVTDPPVIFKDYVEGGGDPRSCGFSVMVERLNISYQPQRKRQFLTTTIL